jgi:hypothetical protein
MSDLTVTFININKIFIPQEKVGKSHQATILEMANEIKADGWPKGKELGVKELPNGTYQVHASYSWFEAGLLSGIETIPCVIY